MPNGSQASPQAAPSHAFLVGIRDYRITGAGPRKEERSPGGIGVPYNEMPVPGFPGTDKTHRGLVNLVILVRIGTAPAFRFAPRHSFDFFQAELAGNRPTQNASGFGWTFLVFAPELHYLFPFSSFYKRLIFYKTKGKTSMKVSYL